MKEKPVILSIKEASKEFHVSESRIYKLIREKEIPHRRLPNGNLGVRKNTFEMQLAALEIVKLLRD